MARDGYEAAVDRELMSACRHQAATVLDRTFELSEVPAPPLDEKERLERVRSWWRSDGLTVIDQPVGNLWSRLRSGDDPSRGAIVVAAHVDTVFGRDVAHGLRRDGSDRIVGPGCGDNTVAVAALSALDRLLPQQGSCDVWIVATVAEEGLGNLAGARAAIEQPPATIEMFIALEGNYLGRVNTVGVGSERRQVQVTAAGGHAWEDADAPNAIHAAAALICAIDAIEVTHPAKTSRNVGIVAGGESINSRARSASFQVDLRSESPEALTELLDKAEAVLGGGRPEVGIASSVLGSRPAGRIDRDHPLVGAAVSALAEAGIGARFTAASTDANAAYGHGIPAVTLGITYGDGTHTESEWIDPRGVPLGLYALTRTIASRSTS